MTTPAPDVEPLTAVAWMVTHHMDKKPNVSVFAIGGPYDDPEAKARHVAAMYHGTVTPLVPAARLAELGALIHYPKHWDTAAYPTFADALREIGCSQCNGLPPPGLHHPSNADQKPAAEREVSGWAPELREIAAAIPQSVHDEVARETAAEREGADAAELKAWREMFAAFAASGLPASWPNPNPKLWPNQWPQDVAMVAFALHRAKAPADAQDAAHAGDEAIAETMKHYNGRNRVECYKIYRSLVGCTLKEARDFVDAAIDKKRQEPPK